MKKKLLLFLVIASAVIGGVYGVTQALFSDTETSAANTLTAGTLDMSVDGENGTAFDSITVSNIGADGTVSGNKEWTISNSGSLPGNLTFQLSSLTNTENGCNEPELATEPACATDANGELGAATTGTISVDLNRNGTFESNELVATSTFSTTNQTAFNTQWTTNAGTITLPAGATMKVKMNWANDPATYGNEIQSDGLSFGVQFNLTQVNPS